MDKRKVLVIGDGGVFTGFSRVLHSIIDYLPDTYEFHHLAVNYRGDPVKTKPNHLLYPAYLGGDLLGFKRLRGMLDRLKPDVIFILNDLWIIQEYMHVLTDSEKAKTVVYFPVDAEGTDSEWLEDFEQIHTIVAYTEFGKSEINKINPYLPVKVIPHGVDHSKFNRIPKSLALAKLNGLSGDEFIVLCLQRNQPRKRIDLTVESFSKFAKDKSPDKVKLYLHMGLIDEGWNVLKLANRYGIEDRLVLTHTDVGPQNGVPDEQLNAIYNVCQVGLNTGQGEGWGLPNMEHAITGGVQVVPDSSACKELYSDCGRLIKIAGNYTYPGVLTIGKVIDTDSAAEQLQTLYDDRELLKELSEYSINKFSDPKYSWKTISGQWDEIFKKI